MSDLLLKQEDLSSEYTAKVWALGTKRPFFQVLVYNSEGWPVDWYDAGGDLEHALEALAAARNSGFNFDRFAAEQRWKMAEERGELDTY